MTGRDRLALSRELGHFLVQFSIALHAQSMYPEGHPSLERATLAVLDHLAILLQERATLSFGVAQRQLVIEGVATDPQNPVLRSLAERLHSHLIGAVTLKRGVDVFEMADVLRTLAVSPDWGEGPLGHWPAERLRAWTHIQLYPLTYDELELVGEREPEPQGEGGEGAEGGDRAEQLWLGLARAALAAEAAAEDLASVEPAAVAKAIEEHPRHVAYDQVIVGYLLQLADELKREGGVGARAMRQRVSKMIASLRPETLRELVTMGGDLQQRTEFVLDASHAFTVDAVLELVQAAADASQETPSHALIRLLSKLAAHAEKGTAWVRSHADAALREQVRQLVEGWRLENPNPQAYTHALERMAKTFVGSEAGGEAVPAPEAHRIVQMSLEADAVGPALWRAVDEMVEAGQLGAVVQMLALTETGAGEALWQRIATPDNVRRLLYDDPVNFHALDRLLARVGPAGAAPLLEALAESESRRTRRMAFDRLSRFGPDIGPLLVNSLADERWYVQRNVLALLNGFKRLPEGFHSGPYAAHPEPRVRREAFKLWLRLPGERDRSLAAALADPDDRVVQVGLSAAQEWCPPDLIPAIAHRATDRRLASEMRTSAIRALRGKPHPVALKALLRLASAGESFLARVRLAPKSPEMLAALSVLAASWSADPHAAGVLAQARKSKDREIRAAAAVEPEAR